MRVLGLPLALELMFGCAHGPLTLANATDANARPVKRVVWFGSREDWTNTAWYRIAEDAIDWPRRVVLAVDDTVCLMDQRDVRDPQPGSSWPCGTAWRTAR